MVKNNQYQEAVTRTLNLTFEGYQYSLGFATFRANLYFLGWSQSTKEDFILYRKLLKQENLYNWHTDNLLDEENFVCKGWAVVDKLFNTYSTIAVTCFHQFTMFALLNYLCMKSVDIILLVSVKNKNEVQNYVQQALDKIRAEKQIDTAITLLYIQEPATFLTLQNKIGSERNKKKILFAFFDGNHYSNSTHNKMCTSLLFNKIPIKQHITNLTYKLKIPLVSFYGIFGEKNITFAVQGVYDYMKNNWMPNQVADDICKNFTKEITKENIYQWSYITKMHNFIERPIVKTKDYLTADNYETHKDRFTMVKIGNENFLFDSKYYLSYPINNINSINDLKACISQLKISF